MDELVQFALVAFTSILFLVDPIAVIPAYLAFTRADTAEHRRRTARVACVVAGIALLIFAAGGDLILRAFGITLPAFRIAGGLILWFVAMDMLRAERTTQEGPPELSEGERKDDVALTPLAVPMLAGPGAMSTVMVLSAQARSPTQTAIVYAAIAVTMVISWMTLRAADRLLTRIGQTGIRVVTRLMGLLLAAIAVEFVLTGVRDAQLMPRLGGAGG
ncbi:MAG: MarC family protein [Gemmatimonadaceae bacterium]